MLQVTRGCLLGARAPSPLLGLALTCQSKCVEPFWNPSLQPDSTSQGISAFDVGKVFNQCGFKLQLGEAQTSFAQVRCVDTKLHLAVIFQETDADFRNQRLRDRGGYAEVQHTVDQGVETLPEFPSLDQQ